MKGLPRGWCRVTIGDVARRVTDGTHQTPKFVPNGVPFLVISNVIGGKLDWPTVYKWVSEQTYRECTATCRPERGDILYTAVGSYGIAVVVDCDERFMFQRHIAHIKPRTDVIDPRFLAAALNGPELRRRADEVARGVAQRTVTLGELKQFPVQLPPVNEQRRIVTKLEALQSRSRRAREALDTVPPLLEKLRQSILSAAFRGDLTKDWRAKHKDIEPATELLKRIRTERRKKWEVAEIAKMKAKGKPPTDDRWKDKYKEPSPVEKRGSSELPDGWCWASVSEVATIQLGQRRAPEYSHETKYPYLRAANITWTGLDLSEVKSMGFADPESVSLEPGDVVLSEASGSPTEVGKPALWNGEIANCCFQATVVRIRPLHTAVEGSWLHLSFLRNAIFGDFARMAPGVGIVHLTAERMRSWPVPLAPPEEQAEIARLTTRSLDRVTQLEAALTGMLSHSARLQEAILTKAFRGELVHQDPNDEPAEALLARLRQETPTPEKRASRRRRFEAAQ